MDATTLLVVAGVALLSLAVVSRYDEEREDQRRANRQRAWGSVGQQAARRRRTGWGRAVAITAAITRGAFIVLGVARLDLSALVAPLAAFGLGFVSLAVLPEGLLFSAAAALILMLSAVLTARALETRCRYRERVGVVAAFQEVWRESPAWVRIVVGGLALVVVVTPMVSLLFGDASVIIVLVSSGALYGFVLVVSIASLHGHFDSPRLRAPR